VVYHSSTYGDFNEFSVHEQREGMAGFGFYFTDRDNSNIYAKHAEKFKMDRDRAGNDKKPSTYPVFLKMENPLVVDDIREVSRLWVDRKVPGAFGQSRSVAGISPDALSPLERAGYDGI